MKRVIWFIILCVSSCVFIASCNKPVKYEFYYYPQKNIYYNVADKQYIYSLNGGKNWDSLYSKSVEPSTLGNKQIIYSETKNAWINNAEHRTLYSGYQLNIISDNDSSGINENVVTERKALKKSTPVKITSDDKNEKKESGFRKFTQKIFGKKKH